MKAFYNVKTDSIDSFCSVLGNELIFEDNDNLFVLIPCFNIGFYENEINPGSITKAYDKCYLLIKNVSNLKVDLNLYQDLFPNSEGIISISQNKVSYKFEAEPINQFRNNFYFEGKIFRNNSFSYGSYNIMAEYLHVVFPSNSLELSEYNERNDYKGDNELTNFLLNRGLDNSFFNYIKEII